MKKRKQQQMGRIALAVGAMVMGFALVGLMGPRRVSRLLGDLGEGYTAHVSWSVDLTSEEETVYLDQVWAKALLGKLDDYSLHLTVPGKGTGDSGHICRVWFVTPGAEREVLITSGGVARVEGKDYRIRPWKEENIRQLEQWLKSNGESSMPG